MWKANFYSLLEKPNLLKEEEDRFKCVPTTQLDGKHLEREVVVIDKILDKIGSAFEVDGVPLNAAQEHLDKDLLTSEQDIEMEYLKELKRDHMLVVSPLKGNKHGRNRRQKK